MDSAALLFGPEETGQLTHQPKIHSADLIEGKTSDVSDVCADTNRRVSTL